MEQIQAQQSRLGKYLVKERRTNNNSEEFYFEGADAFNVYRCLRDIPATKIHEDHLPSNHSGKPEHLIIYQKNDSSLKLEYSNKSSYCGSKTKLAVFNDDKTKRDSVLEILEEMLI